MGKDWFAEENRVIMLYPNAMDPMTRAFWEETRMVIICSRVANAGGGDSAHVGARMVHMSVGKGTMHTTATCHLYMSVSCFY